MAAFCAPLLIAAGVASLSGCLSGGLPTFTFSLINSDASYMNGTYTIMFANEEGPRIETSKNVSVAPHSSLHVYESEVHGQGTLTLTFALTNGTKVEHVETQWRPGGNGAHNYFIVQASDNHLTFIAKTMG